MTLAKTVVALPPSAFITTKRAPGRSQRKKKKNKRLGKSADGIPNITVRPLRTPKRVEGVLTSSDFAQFKLALKNPFDARAIGCRVMDSYVTPTVTYHIRGTINVASNSGGDCYMSVLPSPMVTVLQPSQNGGGPAITGSLTAFTQNTPSATSPGGYYAFAPATMADKLTEYRVVSWGIRFVAKDTALATKGKIYIAQVPTTENSPSWSVLNHVTGSQASLGEYTIGLQLQDLNKIPNLPGVRCFSMQELLRGEVMVVGTPTHQSFYQFKGTANYDQVPWNSNQTLIDEGVFSTVSGALVNYTTAGRKDPASLRGGRAILIYGSGLPASTNEFDLEYVYHLEGTPNMAGTTNYVQLIPSSMRAATGSSAIVEKAISVASQAYVLYQYIRDPLNSAAGTRALKTIMG